MIDRDRAKEIVCANHYTHSFPSGKSMSFEHQGVIVVFSIPANNNISQYLVGERNRVWELARLWAPDGHAPNALTAAMSVAIDDFRARVDGVQALVSYADPSVGHSGGIYRAASWTHLGSCEETRSYRGPDGSVVSRRAFHSGSACLRKAEILAKGYLELRLPGKIRFAKGLTRSARRAIAAKAALIHGVKS